jgi:hypothetical protein
MQAQLDTSEVSSIMIYINVLQTAEGGTTNPSDALNGLA